MTIDALVKRINRRLAREGQQLRTTRGAQMLLDVGRHFIEDARGSFVVERGVDVQELARQLGVRA
jgi:hypothetical protein